MLKPQYKEEGATVCGPEYFKTQPQKMFVLDSGAGASVLDKDEAEKDRTYADEHYTFEPGAVQKSANIYLFKVDFSADVEQSDKDTTAESQSGASTADLSVGRYDPEDDGTSWYSDLLGNSLSVYKILDDLSDQDAISI